jgi:hypothetical protein
VIERFIQLAGEAPLGFHVPGRRIRGSQSGARVTPPWEKFRSSLSGAKASAVLGIDVVEAASGVPFGALVAVGGNPARVLQRSC